MPALYTVHRQKIHAKDDKSNLEHCEKVLPFAKLDANDPVRTNRVGINVTPSEKILCPRRGKHPSRHNEDVKQGAISYFNRHNF